MKDGFSVWSIARAIQRQGWFAPRFALKLIVLLIVLSISAQLLNWAAPGFVALAVAIVVAAITLLMGSSRFALLVKSMEPILRNLSFANVRNTGRALISTRTLIWDAAKGKRILSSAKSRAEITENDDAQTSTIEQLRIALEAANARIPKQAKVSNRTRISRLYSSLDSPGPIVTVVVPLFNEERFVADTINSLKRQSFQNFEVIIVDDSSTDSSADVAIRAIRSDKRFKFVRHQKNSGLSASRNTGLRLATTQYITFLDSDDFLLREGLEIRLKKLVEIEDERVAGVFCGIVNAPQDVALDFEPSNMYFNGKVMSFVSSEGECPFTAHAPILRTDVARKMGGFDESFKDGAEDWDFWLRIMRHGYIFLPVPIVGGIYRNKRGSMVIGNPIRHLRVATKILDWANAPLLTDEIVPGTPAVFLRPASDYRHQLLAAPRILQFLGLTSLVDLNSFEEAVASLDLKFWPYISKHLGAESVVRTGIQRWLAVGGECRSLDAEIQKLCRAILSHISDRSAALDDDTIYAANLSRTACIAFLAGNRKHAKLFVALAEQARAAGVTAYLVSTETISGDQGVETYWNESGQKFIPYNMFALRRGAYGPHASVVMRPYGSLVSEFAKAAQGKIIEINDPAALVGHPDENTTLQPDVLLEPKDWQVAISEIVQHWQRSQAPESKGTDASGQTNNIAIVGNSAPGIIHLEESVNLSPDFEMISKFRNRFKGERCFVIGNGPSLNELDLTKLKNDYVFAVNAIFYKKSELGFDPSFYVVEDSSVMSENTEAIRNFNADHKFFPTIYRKYELAADNVHFFRMNRGFYERQSPFYCVPRFSTDASQRVYCGQSVTHINLQLAYYFGFKTVYLIGMDFSYVIPASAIVKGDLILSTEDDPNHFNSAYFGAGKTWKDPKLHRVKLNYELARDIFSSDDREIINATKGGKLDVFRRANYDDLF